MCDEVHFIVLGGEGEEWGGGVCGGDVETSHNAWRGGGSCCSGCGVSLGTRLESVFESY